MTTQTSEFPPLPTFRYVAEFRDVTLFSADVDAMREQAKERAYPGDRVDRPYDIVETFPYGEQSFCRS